MPSAAHESGCKADGYGSGAAAVAKRLMAEARAPLRRPRPRRASARGDRARAVIYILDGCHGAPHKWRRHAWQSNLRPVINHPTQLQTWQGESSAGACGLQIDTGMNRLGFRVEDAPAPLPGLELR